jgi:hypothetical protein
MPDTTPDDTAILDDADRTLVRLEKLCCAPGRSPQMTAIADDLAGLRASLHDFSGAQADADPIIAAMEVTGGRIGRLQVGCCAPARMPLYADLLTSLTELQRNVNAQVGRGH